MARLIILHHFWDIMDYFPKYKKSRGSDHVQLRVYLSIRRQYFITSYGQLQCTNFEISSLSRSRDILGRKILNGSRNLTNNYDPFSLSSTVWDFLCWSCTPNLKSLCWLTTKILKATRNVEIGVVWGLGSPTVAKTASRAQCKMLELLTSSCGLRIVVTSADYK